MNIKWYMIKVKLGYETKVVKIIKENLEERNDKYYLKNFIIPVEGDVKKIGKKNELKKIFPGYILINMYLNKKTLTMINSIEHIRSYINKNNKPIEISRKKIREILLNIRKKKEITNKRKNLEIGKNIKIINGAFEGSNGIVEKIYKKKKRLKILVAILGRVTSIEVNFDEVENK